MIKSFLDNESGATAIEYGLIAALIAVALIGGATLLGGSLDSIYNRIEDSIS